ncbi:unnamed protein product [Symbiodinium sp. CCMP2592]|nr:unnamed protein product [Symbiodinium sp. CCMP2592]
MPPKGPSKVSKQPPKGGGKGQDFPTSKLEFGYPQALNTALQAIGARATQDLWRGPQLGDGDATAEQLAQRRANLVSKLAKRVDGDARAKQALKEALAAWSISLGNHLEQLLTRVRALSNKLDEDLVEACGELETQTRDVASSSTDDKIAAARASLGPAWNVIQEAEVNRLAAGLRAFGSVAADGMAGGLLSGPATNHAPLPVGVEGSEVSFGGWIPELVPPSGQDYGASSASIAGGAPSPPASSALFLGVSRPRQTAMDEDPELIPDKGALQEAWCRAWMAILAMVAESGDDVVGELSVCDEQEAALPRHKDDQSADKLVAAADELWEFLVQVVAAPSLEQLAALHARLHTLLCDLRSCSGALPRIRQGLLVAIHAALGSLLDPFSYAPGTLQEWLHPSLVVEQGLVRQGYLATEMASNAHAQILCRMPCPFPLATAPQPSS